MMNKEVVRSLKEKFEHIGAVITLLTTFNIDSRNYIYNAGPISELANDLESSINEADDVITANPWLRPTNWDAYRESAHAQVGGVRYALELAKHVDPNDPTLGLKGEGT